MWKSPRAVLDAGDPWSCSEQARSPVGCTSANPSFPCGSQGVCRFPAAGCRTLAAPEQAGMITMQMPDRDACVCAVPLCDSGVAAAVAAATAPVGAAGGFNARAHPGPASCLFHELISPRSPAPRRWPHKVVPAWTPPPSRQAQYDCRQSRHSGGMPAAAGAVPGCRCPSHHARLLIDHQLQVSTAPHRHCCRCCPRHPTPPGTGPSARGPVRMGEL